MLIKPMNIILVTTTGRALVIKTIKKEISKPIVLIPPIEMLSKEGRTSETTKTIKARIKPMNCLKLRLIFFKNVVTFVNFLQDFNKVSYFLELKPD